MALYYAHNEAWPSFQILINLEGANITKTIPYIRIPSIRLRTFYLFYPAKILLISWYMINTVRFHVEKLICIKKKQVEQIKSGLYSNQASISEFTVGQCVWLINIFKPNLVLTV